jgi:hypothetical protein
MGNEQSEQSDLETCKFKTVSDTFNEALQKILQQNSTADLVEALLVVTRLIKNLLSLKENCDADGVDRSQQHKFRTIFSQNTVVNNKLLSLNGNIEDLLIMMGYTTQDLGNPDLKPNFYFSSRVKDDFIQIEKCQ